MGLLPLVYKFVPTLRARRCRECLPTLAVAILQGWPHKSFSVAIIKTLIEVLRGLLTFVLQFTEPTQISQNVILTTIKGLCAGKKEGESKSYSSASRRLGATLCAR